jgi:phenylacetate-CoA ligase
MIETEEPQGRARCPQRAAATANVSSLSRYGEDTTPCQGTQLERLNALLAHTWKHNLFYRAKWQRAGVSSQPLDCTEDLQQYPFTTRAELLEDQAAHPPLGTNASCAITKFKRFLHSSGTTRHPMLWADTPRTWEWVTRCSAALHALTGVRARDTVLFVTNLGGTSGPWVILEGARRLGCACLTCGSHDVNEAIQWLASMQPNVLVGKPEPLLMFAMALRSRGLAPSAAGIKRVILTGEGSSIGSSPREELEQCWGAPCFDRYGMTEAGSIAAECVAHTGALHLLDDEFIAEVIDPFSQKPLGDGESGELILTSLGRLDRPIVRYRTGDRTILLRNHRCSCGREGTVLPQGIPGRLR